MSYAHSWGRGGAGYGTETSRQALDYLHGLGVDSISLTPFGYQRALDSTEIRVNRSRPGTETDSAMIADINYAHSLGMKIMLKPHLWLNSDDWVGDIEMKDDDAWRAWFASYENFILPYAQFAQDNHIDFLCIGTELKRTTLARPHSWRELIAKIRAVYKGPITYASNWDEFDKVAFWDSLDAVGVNAFSPLTEKSDPSYDDLLKGAQVIRKNVSAVARKTKKPVIFTEVGFRSTTETALHPWSWTEREPLDLEIQRDCYRAILETFYDEPWLKGMYWWKWNSGPSRGGENNTDYTPKGKPAEKMISEWYARAPGVRTASSQAGSDAAK